MEYLRTLTTKGPNIYSKDMRGYRILYFNLWLDKNYMGRLCVNELQSLILPSHFLATTIWELLSSCACISICCSV